MSHLKIVSVLCVLMLLAVALLLLQEGEDQPTLTENYSTGESTNVITSGNNSCADAAISVDSAKVDNVASSKIKTDRNMSVSSGGEIDIVDKTKEEPISSKPQISENGSSASIVKYTYGPQTASDWDVDKSTLESISEDSSLSDFERSNASDMLRFRFSEWRGRQRGRLGGYEFDLSNFSMLEGWTETQTAPPELDWDKSTSACCIERRITLSMGEAKLTIRVRVAVSVGFAHYLMMKPHLSFLVRSAPHDQVDWWGDLHGVEIGDVWAGDSNIQQSNSHSGGFVFTRRNVIVSAYFDNGPKSGEPITGCSLNVLAFAREIDSQIIAQGLPGYNWSDIAEHCPKITQFEADSNTLTVGGATFSPFEKDRAKAEPKNYSLVKFNVEPEQDGDKISWVGVSGGAASLNLNYTIPYASTGYLEPKYLDTNPSTSKVWLVAINERNLLFSVAEIEFTLVKP